MLELQDLSKRFGDVVALDRLSMQVLPSGLHGFVGRNGAGKTTTMRIALGVLDSDSGSVLWDGQPPTIAQRRRFGYLPEERGLYPKMRLVEQVAFLGELSGMVRGDALAEAGRWLTQLGLGERLNSRAEELSLGNQQRVQLATALVQSPDLLILDEPFSGLDPVGVDLLSEVLRGEAARGAAVVLSSHQLDLVERLCDSVTIVDRGRVVADGPVRTMRRQHSRRLLRIELDGGWSQWATRLPAVRSVHREAGDSVLVELIEGADDQDVLDAARAAGRVVTFQRVLPTLSELFREVVADDSRDRATDHEAA